MINRQKVGKIEKAARKTWTQAGKKSLRLATRGFRFSPKSNDFPSSSTKILGRYTSVVFEQRLFPFLGAYIVKNPHVKEKNSTAIECTQRFTGVFGHRGLIKICRLPV